MAVWWHGLVGTQERSPRPWRAQNASGAKEMQLDSQVESNLGTDCMDYLKSIQPMEKLSISSAKTG